MGAHWQIYTAFTDLRKTLDYVFHGDEDDDVTPIKARR
jgi:hypothetical protein